MKHEPMKFTLELEEVLVELTDSKEGVLAYTLKELNGRQRAKYLSCVNENSEETGEISKKDGKPVVKITNFAAVQTMLLHLSLVDDKNKHAPMEKIEAWPSRVVGALYKKARQISALDDEADEKAGNDSPANESSG